VNLQNPDNSKLIFHIERIEGNFDVDNKVYGTNARMVREIHGNEFGELNPFIDAKLADLECYPGSIGGNAFSGNLVSTFAR
jgi:hypothetical protein